MVFQYENFARLEEHLVWLVKLLSVARHSLPSPTLHPRVSPEANTLTVPEPEGGVWFPTGCFYTDKLLNVSKHSAVVVVWVPCGSHFYSKNRGSGKEGNWKLPALLICIQNGLVAVHNNRAGPHKVKDRASKWASRSVPRLIPKRAPNRNTSQ